MVHTHAAHNVRVHRRFFRLTRKNVVAAFFKEGSMFLQSTLIKKKPSAKPALSKSFSIITEALLLYYGTVHANEYMAGGRLHAKVQWKMGCRMEVAVQIVIRP